MDEVTVVGRVGLFDFGGTSKSAHAALEIQTSSDRYLFKIIGENPFEMSSKFEDICGKTVRASGFLKDKTLMVQSYSVEKD